eukprot:g4166.t1
MDLPDPVRLAAKSSAERKNIHAKKSASKSAEITSTADYSHAIFAQKKEGESLFLIDLDATNKISDEMNPILGMYKMPTPAYYLRGCFPMGDLKCIVKCKSTDVPIKIPSHMERIVREWIRDGKLEQKFGPPLKSTKKKKNHKMSLGPPKDFVEVPVWQFSGNKGTVWKNYLKEDGKKIENAWKEKQREVSIQNKFGSFNVLLGADGEEMAQTEVKTGIIVKVRRLPGSPVYPDMQFGARVEVKFQNKWYAGHYNSFNERKKRFKVQCDSDKQGTFTQCSAHEIRRLGREGLPEIKSKDDDDDGAATKEDGKDEKPPVLSPEEQEKQRILADKKRRADAVVDTDFDFDFFWVVSDVSTIAQKHHASIWNLVHHPWCFPQVTLGSPDFVNTIPIGLFTTLDSDKCFVREADQSNGLTVNDLCFMKVYVHKHPKDQWAMCCSPDNAAFRLDRKKPLAFFWSAAIMGLPDPPARGGMRGGLKAKPTFSKEKELVKYDNTCFSSPNQIVVHDAKLWKKEESLRIVRGRPKPCIDGKTQYDLPDWKGLYFDRMGNKCSITFDCVEAFAFRGTMIRGGHKTRWEVHFSDDNKTYTKVKAFPDVLTKDWDALDWDDVGAHRYWRYQCVENPDTAIDYYRGVEWYVAAPKSKSSDDEIKGGHDEEKSMKPKVRVCISLQWVLQKSNAKLNAIFDKSKTLGDLLTALSDHFGDDDTLVYDLLSSFSELSKWKASMKSKETRERFIASCKKSRGFEESKAGREIKSRGWGGSSWGSSSSTPSSYFYY